MDFLHEADNAEEFLRLNRDVAYVGCPKPYRELSTRPGAGDGSRGRHPNRRLRSAPARGIRSCRSLPEAVHQLYETGAGRRVFPRRPAPGQPARARRADRIGWTWGWSAGCRPGTRPEFEKALGRGGRARRRRRDRRGDRHHRAHRAGGPQGFARRREGHARPVSGDGYRRR